MHGGPLCSAAGRQPLCLAAPSLLGSRPACCGDAALCSSGPQPSSPPGGDKCRDCLLAPALLLWPGGWSALDLASFSKRVFICWAVSALSWQRDPSRGLSCPRPGGTRFPDQGWNPSLLHWKLASQYLAHPASPSQLLFVTAGAALCPGVVGCLGPDFGAPPAVIPAAWH